MSAEVEKPAAAESAVTQEQRPLSPSSDSEIEDTFEDAPDTASIRSLTKRKASVPRPESQQSELAAAFQKIKEKKTVKGQDVTSPTSENTPVTKPKQQDGPGTKAPVPAPDQPAVPPKDSESDADDGPESPSSATADHLSKTSNGALDNVSLHEDAPATNGSREGGERTPSPTERAAPKTLSLSSITHALPAMPWSPPANESPTKTAPPAITASSQLPSPAAVPPAPEPISRKLTSPFAWLSRNTSKDKDSPPVPSPRRNTASSVATLTSMDEEKGGARNSLKDRFKLVRMREEAGITSLPEEDESENPTATAKPNANALSPAASIPGGAGADGIDSGMQPPSSPLPKSPNPSLAPGTVSGVDAGPSPAAGGAPVDWDLWQSVVYEGPAAVARTSSEELNRAIAVGIPNVIRGVV